jgi:hypothetical protein
MVMKLLSLLFSAFSIAYARAESINQGYILTPKENNVNTINFLALAEEHNLQPLANFNHEDNPHSVPTLQFYWSSESNVKKYAETLSLHFEIEPDVQVNLDPHELLTLPKKQVLSESHEFVLVPNLDNEWNYKLSESAPWHLDRITKHNLPLDHHFPYRTAGSCHTNNQTVIHTYIVDTGIDVFHPQFGERAVWGANFVDTTNTDCNNHGTHVAGLVGSHDYGVCVDANLVAVKVLDCQGSGSLSGVIQGIDWAFKEHKNRSKNETRLVKGVINMSLGGGYSRALNRAVEACLSKDPNFYIVVAAGNENQDACELSPAGANGVITVMASDSSDERAWFSNWGECGNVYAPGVDVLSTIPNGKTAQYSGTSMASPVMAGVLNHYLDQYPKYNQKQIVKLIGKLATPDVIASNRKGTVNRLVYLERNN